MPTHQFSRGGLFRPGITIKLFLAILAVCAIMALGMSLATRFSFQKGFLEYLLEIEQERMTMLAYELAVDYKQDGDFDALRTSKNWRKMIASFIRRAPDPQGRPERKSPKKYPFEAPPPPPPKPRGGPSPVEQARRTLESVQLHSSLGLLTPDKKQLIAGVQPGPEASWIPITVDGDTVGWLTREPLRGITDSVDLRFHEQQRTAIMIIAVLSLLLAAMAAMLMARMLFAPLRRFADTTSRLAAGDFSARVPQGKGTRFPRFAKRRPRLTTLPRHTGPEASGRAGHASYWEGDELQVLAKQLNHLAGVLEKNEKARRTFMAEIAHDLRTPLAILKAELEALEDGVRKVTPESLASLRSEVDLLGLLVDDIHTLSLADLGILHYSPQRLDLDSHVASVLAGIQRRIEKRGLRLETEIPSSETTVDTDPARLNQILRNVLENSMRYTGPGGIIQVRCHSDARQAYIDVLDSEPGVPEEQLPFLFDRFYTGDAARSRARSGSGLGLAICQTLLQNQGGSIRALPSPLGGLWIRIILPSALKD